MTQNELAKISGVSQSTISKYENGEYRPDLKNLKNIASSFNCGIDDLYEWNYIVPVLKK